ncbi:acyl--CoA ligase [Kribbella sp. NBC_01245]|uniref:class I adenylate-forming enzyme family protein n=1 Tax=Kribbella sp. NBC_01245 TaxID=2903578 RepID=UPI002E2A3604|nr:class I adenylate-forming enzyme family protein [Kribbella sp. NBC_01245]
MRTLSRRAALAADPAVGAGNVLARVLAGGADPSGPGITFDTAVDGFAAEHPLTLGELDERVDARAAWLHAHGVKPRDPIAIWTSSAADHILGFLALTRLGAIPALINGNLAAEIVAEYIRRLRAVGVIGDGAHLELLRPYDLGTPILGDSAAIAEADPADAPTPYRHHQDDPIVITHTSGTTGIPKSVLHTHSSLFAATRHLLTMPQAQGTGRILNALPAPHTATVLMMNQALGNRAEFFALSSQAGDAVVDAIQRWKPESVFGFSVTWAELARQDLSAYDLSSVRLWFNTGDCTHEPHVRKLVAQGNRDTVSREGVVRVPGSHFIDGLGSSEMGHSMFHVTHRIDTDSYGRCIGKPYKFVDVAVLSLDGEEVGVGEVGHLGIKSPTLSPGYWNDSGTTYRFRLNGYYLTGDLVYRDAEGRFFHMDRAADSTDGFYTAQAEERILVACPDVADCTAVIVNENGQVITDVLLELAPDALDRDRTEEVRKALGDELGATLRKVEASADIPKGATGKVRKVLLRERQLTS